MQKKFGQKFEDAVYGGLQSIVQNPKVRETASNIKEGFFNLYDPIAAKTTEIGLPLLQTLTPEIYYDKATREKMTEGIEPYKPNPEGMSNMERLGRLFDEAKAEFGALGQTFFGQARSAAEKLDKGVAFKDLTPEEQSGARMFGFDVATAMIPGGIFSKPAVKGATALGKDLLTDNSFRVSAGGERIVDAVEDLRPTEKFFQNTRNYQAFRPKEKLTNILNLAEKIHDTPIEELNSSLVGLARENKYDDLLRFVNRPGRGDVDEINPIVRKTFNQFSLVSKEKLDKLESNVSTLRKGSATKDKIYDFVDSAISEGTTFPTNASLARAAGISENSMANYKLQDENFKNKVNDIVDIALKGTSKDLKKVFKRETNVMFDKGKLAKYYQDLDPQLFNRVKQLREAGDFKEKVARPFGLFQDYMYDKFRSIKQTSGNEKLTAKDFVNNYLDDTDLDKFKTYVNKEVDRLNLTVASRNVIDELAKDPKYQPYLVKDGKIDYDLLRADKAHDIPMFVTRVEGSGKYKDVGRFKGAGVEPDFIQPNYQIHNRLQLRLDPFANLYADILSQKGLKDQLSKKPIGKIGNKKSSISVSNPINQNLLDTLKEYGYEPNLKKFNNQYEFVEEVSNVIDGLYKDRLIRTVVPVRRQGGLKDSVIFGIEDPSVVSVNDRLLLGSERLKEILDYAVENNLKPSDIKDAGGYLKGFKDGGYVGDMIPVKANVGKFIKGLFGETPAYRKEGMDVTDLFGPTKKQKQTLEQLYPGKSFPETYPGEVFYSNFDLALSRRGAPESFQNEDSFRNYMNQSGVGTDELDDAKVIPYIKSKSQGGEQIFSQDLRRIANQSPIRSVFMDAYGFRSDKINQASRDIFDPNTGSRVQVEGQAVFKDPAYSGTAIMDGELANTYRERVFRIKKDKLRGDPGSVPGGADNHKFGGTPDTEGNYTLFWTRQTDRPAYIIPGEVVDKKTGEIISPSMLSDQTKLKGIEDRIQKLFADPIATLNPEDLEGVSATVKRLVDSSAGRLTSGKAYNVVMGQIDAKQKQIKRLQNEYNVEKERLDNFVSPQKKEIVTTMIDELQSDILQSLRTKSRNIAGKLKIMADRNMSIDSMRDKELLEYFQDTGGVVRPLGKTKEELLDQFNQLKEINKQLKESSQKFAFGITEGDLNYYNSVKQMQQQIINEMTNNISKDLMQKLYPDVPFKDRIQYADAAVKQSVAEAAHRLFIEKDPNAPKYISYMSGAQIKSNYNQPGGAATPAAERSADLDTRQRMFEQSFAGGNEGAVLEQSELRGIGTEEFYGGPDVKNEQGAHFTGVMENIFKKIANEYGSKIEIANVATQDPRVRDVYNIIDQDTGVVMGSGDTYRQAENIANDLVEEGGGRYRIATETERVYDSRPVFTMEITPEMLQLFKAYK